MKSKGHEVLVISRNKEIEHILLKEYGIPFIDRGKGRKNIVGKIFYFFKALFIIYKHSKIFKPDIILSFGTPYPAIAGWLLKIPHVSINDTEFASLHHLFTDPFSKYILTPDCYKKNLGKKQLFFNSFLELCYLHPKYFSPDPSILSLLRMKENEKYVVLRFVSGEAVHDVCRSGLSLNMKKKYVNELSKFAKVFITSETELPKELEPYKMNIPANRMHDAIYYASLMIGESATMASEGAVLGTPAVYVDKIGRGYTEEEQIKYGLVWNFGNSLEQQAVALGKGIEILKNSKAKLEAVEKSKILQSEKNDITAFMVWFIENYPESVNIMKTNPDYQNNFKK